MGCAPTTYETREWTTETTTADGLATRATFGESGVEYAALEIGAASDIPAVIVENAGSQAILSVGNPLIGPFRGPIRVKAVTPVVNSTFAPAVSPLDGGNQPSWRRPRLQLALHRNMPGGFARSRAMASWDDEDITHSFGGTLTSVQRIWFAGRKVAEIGLDLQSDTATAVDVVGVITQNTLAIIRATLIAETTVTGENVYRVWDEYFDYLELMLNNAGSMTFSVHSRVWGELI